MKVAGDIRGVTCTQIQLAKALGLSQSRISQLLDEDIVVRDKESKQVLLFESVKRYYLNKNTGGADAEVNYNVERALYMKAKRELAELKLSKARGELYLAAEVETAFVNMLTILRTNLLTIPAKYAAQLEGANRETIYNALMSEIEWCLKELSSFDLSKLSGEAEDLADEDD